MTNQYSLHPFEPENFSGDLNLQGNLNYEENLLHIEYVISDDWQKVKIPSKSNSCDRQDGLWETTCLEFFIGIVDSPIYWEFNLSPSGCWNVYRFTGYREGMEIETAFENLPFEFIQQSDRLLLQIQIDTTQIVKKSQALEIAITTVIEEQEGNISYWALKHSGKQADFHLRDSFVPL